MAEPELRNERLRQLHIDLNESMHDISTLFKPGVKLTLVARTPDLPDADVVVSDDSLDAAIAAIRRSQERETDQISEKLFRARRL